MAPPSLIWMTFGFSVGFALMVASLILARHGYQRWGFSERELASIDQLPMAITYLGMGIVGFCLFFPCFLAFYYVRYFHSEIDRLERQVAALSPPSTPEPNNALQRTQAGGGVGSEPKP